MLSVFEGRVLNFLRRAGYAGVRWSVPDGSLRLSCSRSLTLPARKPETRSDRYCLNLRDQTARSAGWLNAVVLNLLSAV